MAGAKKLKAISYFDAKMLENFTRDGFTGLGMPKESSSIIAVVLLTLDLRAIDSHGV